MSIPPRSAAAWREFRDRSGRIAASALVVSCCVHVLVLTLSPNGEVDGGHDRRSSRSPPSTGSRGLRLLVLAPRQASDPDRPTLPEIAAAASASDTNGGSPETSVRTTTRALSAEPTGGMDGGNGAEEGRAPNPLIWDGFGDLRLAAGLPILSPEDALAEALARPEGYVSPLRQCYDSIDARAARARKAQDWSRRDRRGWRWGISTDGIHLGPVTVPIAPPPPPPGETNWRPDSDPCVDR